MLLFLHGDSLQRLPPFVLTMNEGRNHIGEDKDARDPERLNKNN